MRQKLALYHHQHRYRRQHHQFPEDLTQCVIGHQVLIYIYQLFCNKCKKKIYYKMCLLKYIMNSGDRLQTDSYLQRTGQPLLQQDQPMFILSWQGTLQLEPGAGQMKMTHGKLVRLVTPLVKPTQILQILLSDLAGTLQQIS